MALLPVDIGQIVAKKYQVDKIIGQGGMGVVVSAHHIELDQKVAIKFLLADVAEHAEAAERFRREARAAAQIHSDHVVRVLDVGNLPDGVPFLVMEYLEGKDLGECMQQGEPFAVDEAVAYALEAIDAMFHAHAAGIVHRDLKPANLFLAKRPDGSLRIKVLDFGISKSVRDSLVGDLRLTSTTTLIGSPLYMSPEQMQSARDVDQRADIWSLGAILFEMLARRPPYQANTLPALCQALATSDPPPLRQFRPDVPPVLEAAVARCLMRDLNQRWPNVRELGAALSPFAPKHQSVRPLFVTADATKAVPAEPPTERTGDNPVSTPQTLDPWGNTQNKSASKRTRTLVIVAALVGLAGLVAVFFGLPVRAPTPAPPAALEHPKLPVSGSKDAPESLIQPVTRPAVEAVAPLDAEKQDKDTAPEPEPPAKPAPANEVAPKAPALDARARRLPATTPAAMPEARGAPRTETPASPTPASGVSDFGGRR